MLRIIFFLLIGAGVVYGNIFSDASRLYNIDDKVLYAIAKTESRLEHLAIGTMPKNRDVAYKLIYFLDKIDCKYNVNSKDYSRISIFPKDNQQAKMAYIIVDKFNINYDLGLTQINKGNVERMNLDAFELLFNPKYNVGIGAKILDECIKYNNGHVHYSLECYNKGRDKRKYNGSYSNLVLKEYKKLVSKK